MPKFATERRVAHAARKMFDLVADVDAYPRFVPLCESVTVRGRGTEHGKEIIVVDMTVAYKAIRQSFTTRDILDRDALVIDVRNVDGPFRRLDSRWSFVSADEHASTVRFEIDYEFKSRILAAVMGAIFARVFAKFIEAFEQRADQVDGARTG
jgi:coenzyme Q-binding protein COQ10